MEERIDQALEIMLDRRLLKDKLVSKLQVDEKRLAEITDELEHYGAKTVPNQRDLDVSRQQLNEALDQDFDIRKPALHTLIRKIELDEDGQLDFDFYLASDVLASTPTAVHTSDNFPARKIRCQDGVKIFTGSTHVRGMLTGGIINLSTSIFSCFKKQLDA